MKDTRLQQTRRNMIQYYIAFVMVIVVFVLLSFQIIYTVIFENTIKGSYQQLGSAINELDEKMIALESMSVALSYHVDTNNLMALENISTEKVVELAEYRNLLSISLLESSDIADYYIFFPRSGIIFDSTRVYADVDELYGDFASIDGFDRADFTELLLHENRVLGKAQTLVTENKRQQVIPYRVQGANNDNINIVLMLRLDAILNTINHNMSKYNTINILYDNEIIYSSNNDDDTSNIISFGGDFSSIDYRLADKIVISRPSSHYPITYQTIIDKESISSTIDEIMRAYLIIFGLIGLAVTFVLLCMQFWFSKPLYKISRLYNEQERAIEKYHLNRLLETAASDEEVQVAADFFTIDTSKKALAMIVWATKNESDKLLSKTVSTEIGNVLGKGFSTRRMGDNKSVVLLYNIENEEDTIEKVLTVIKKYNQDDEVVGIGCGNSYQNQRGISLSFLEAHKVVAYQQNYNNHSIYRYSYLPMVKDSIVLERDVRNKILLFISTKESEKAINLFTKVFTDELEHAYVVNPAVATNVTAQIVSILILSVREIVKDKSTTTVLLIEISKLFNVLQKDDFLKSVNTLITKISQCVPDKEETDNNLMKKMMSYITEHYADSDLSLSMLGDKFGMNESYISQYFKQHTDTNFTQHLEKIRMEHAVEMLEGETPINKIVELVGYSNRNTFYKAFIRVHGISPTKFRENQQLKKQNNSE